MSLRTKSFAAIGAIAIAAQADVSFTPVTAGATESAQKLYNFLAVNYGVNTVSGVMTGAYDTLLTGSGTPATIDEDFDVATVKQLSGKTPALVGFDLMNATGKTAASGDTWYKNYTETGIALAKDLWSKGGIPAFTWHWRDPSKATDAFYNKKGNSQDYTTFDFTQGFTDPSCTANCTWNTESETYKQMVADIDVIADYFLELQTAGVAAIFRPLHEASGTWFWWGEHGGAAFVALYNLIYDELVSVKNVKNLVWVWNPEYTTDTDWNPGATKYDVISLDIYEVWNYTTKYTMAYKELTTNYSTLNKIFAISENGPIPDYSSNADAGAVWSWWMPWYESWSGKFPSQTATAVWKANMDNPCTFTLETMPGWSAYTISTTKASACVANYKLADLDTARSIQTIVPGDTATNRWLMAQLSAGEGDTAKGNIVVKQGSIDLSTAKTVSFNVINGNTQAGVWFTVAFLGDASTGWAWAQPEGCWINAGDSTTCEIKLSTMAKSEVTLTDAEYAAFMPHISKMYIEVFAAEWSGNIFFDDISVDGTTYVDFGSITSVKTEQAQNLTVSLIGKGMKPAGIQTTAVRSGIAQFSMQNRTLALNLPTSGKVAVHLFDVNGHLVKSLANGSLTAGSHEFSLQGLSQGSYIVRAKGSFGVATQRILVK